MFLLGSYHQPPIASSSSHSDPALRGNIPPQTKHEGDALIGGAAWADFSMGGRYTWPPEARPDPAAANASIAAAKAAAAAAASAAALRTLHEQQAAYSAAKAAAAAELAGPLRVCDKPRSKLGPCLGRCFADLLFFLLPAFTHGLPRVCGARSDLICASTT